uniref:Putative extracellular protein CSOL_026 n=1 Tax=Pseudococcomyxa simplex TaxID=464287 RepID=A0A7L9QE09_9CHLO|nr:putative extracellular protein CSOL_026 [Pseudococcomyxa simplex]
MKGVTRQIFAAIGIFGVLVCHAAVDPCSEQYPHLGTDFVTSQSKTVALTFDDAPDPVNTARILDDLSAAGVKATFFVNTNNQMNVASSTQAQALLQRIRDEGHTIGSHTVDHISLDNLDTTRIEYELGGLEGTLGNIGLAAPRLFRAPHGTPFLNPNSADLPRVASVVRRHAVDISWTFAGSNQLDWDCDTNVQCVLNNYLSYFSGGSSGIPLMHAVKAGTAGAVPQLISAGKAAGINFVSVDNFVQEKYGMSSADVVSRVNSNCPNINYNSSTSSGSSSGNGNRNGGGRRSGPGNPGDLGGPGDGGPGGPGGGPDGPGSPTN